MYCTLLRGRWTMADRVVSHGGRCIHRMRGVYNGFGGVTCQTHCYSTQENDNIVDLLNVTFVMDGDFSLSVG